LRRSLKIGIGTGGSEPLLRASRAHGNFAEYVPLTLVLTVLLELQSAPQLLLHLLCAALSCGRIVHAYGVSRSPENYVYRVVGMALTFSALGGAAIALLIVGLASGVE
jgi:uncharacterized membrane protein YecN with MAPEG domain